MNLFHHTSIRGFNTFEKVHKSNVYSVCSLLKKAAMTGAGTSDDDKAELDVILQEFNEKWFKGWDTTPEEQKVKLTAIVNAVKQDNDYITLIVGNPDKQAAEEALDKIIDRIVRRQRQKDMSLYKEYMNEDFKINFRSLVTRMIETPSLVTR